MKPVIQIEKLYKKRGDIKTFICVGDFSFVTFKNNIMVGWLLGETGNIPRNNEDYEILDTNNLLANR